MRVELPNDQETSHAAALSKTAFPQPVVDFLVKHEGFSLKKWLDQVDAFDPAYRKPFLENMALVLQAANSNHLSNSRMEQLVSDFADLWIATGKGQAATAIEKT